MLGLFSSTISTDIYCGPSLTVSGVICR